jgi:phytoene dehydrogenase-like protein
VGARVAGASLGILLARQGRSVLLLDREEFPSDTLSTHYVHPFGVANLARPGVLDDLLATGFQKLTRIRTHVEDCLFEAPVAPAGGFGLAPRRSILDALLQEHAVAAGAELLTRTRAEGLVEEDSRGVGVVATDAATRASACEHRSNMNYSTPQQWPPESRKPTPPNPGYCEVPAKLGPAHGTDALCPELPTRQTTEHNDRRYAKALRDALAGHR